MIIYLGTLLPANSCELTFRSLAATLLLLQVGFTTAACHHAGSTVAFVYRTKTSVHFSPFLLFNELKYVALLR
jgi:hypothetical protein